MADKIYPKKHIELLGMKVIDRITGFEGIVTTVGFDLYGCIQVDVRPVGRTADGKLMEGYWFDIGRIEVINNIPIMNPPNFEYSEES